VESTLAGPYRRFQATQGHHFNATATRAHLDLLARPAWPASAGCVMSLGHRASPRTHKVAEFPWRCRSRKASPGENQPEWLDRTGSCPAHLQGQQLGPAQGCHSGAASELPCRCAQTKTAALPPGEARRLA